MSSTAPPKPTEPPTGADHPTGPGHPAKHWSLRARMLAALIALLALICLVIGVFTHTVMSNSLYGQLDEQLEQASNRAAAFDGNASGQGSNAPDPLNAPGQGSGTLNARIEGNTILIGGVLDRETGVRKQLNEKDAQQLAEVAADATPSTQDLSVGRYRLMAVTSTDSGHPAAGASGKSILITGLPVENTRRTLFSLDITMLLVASSGLVATGLIGSVIVRRSLVQLERVSSVAGSVAELPLDVGEVRLAQRVAAADAEPGTEAGNMGHALNALLDNVESALEVRQNSEARMRRFVADASHELRTPLAAVRGYSELVAATEHLSADGRTSLGRVVEQSHRMGSLVEDLLLLARLDEGQKPTTVDVDLTQVALETARDFQVAAPTHRWRLNLPDEPVVVRGDGTQLARVLNNLLSNARKHTVEGTTVDIGVARSADARHGVLTVTDDGEGIDAEFLPQVFARFTRADNARSGAEGTVGLGLPIVRGIVESHGGTIHVSSRPGHTEFEVRLPLAFDLPPRPDQPPQSAA
ncbi:HAMP domain-containing sensor histidine kinase [Arthrobacter rhombi]|uniref:sensor histidine kinase n=1 Tax=Arthrobacter rhombi TaxID=71253 RepID=UPI0031D3765B